jgi:8-oxo-dGTP pyrophosphatase MutT (NUDIX family)
VGVVAKPGLRKTSRIVVMDETDAVLLFLTQAPDSSRFHRWITPGGGVDPGETHHRAAVRELKEETGHDFVVSPTPVWTYEFQVTFDEADHDRGYAEYFFLRTKRFEPLSDLWTPEEHIDVTDWGWFAPEEIGTRATPYEPAHLPTLVWELRSHL